MSSILTPMAEAGVALAPGARPIARKKHSPYPAQQFRFPAHHNLDSEDTAHRQAELFYLQKQIQSQTQMVIVLEDGEEIEGCIEWYDRHTLKVRGRQRLLIFKSAIKYMYKHGENGSS